MRPTGKSSTYTGCPISNTSGNRFCWVCRQEEKEKPATGPSYNPVVRFQ